MQAFRQPTGIIRALNVAVLGFFVTTFYAPSAQAIKTGIKEQEKQAKLEASLPENQSDTALYASKLKKMKGHFKEAERLYVDQKNSVIGQITDIKGAIDNGGSIFKQDDRWKKELSTGLTLAGEAVNLNSKVDKDFKQVKDWIKAKELPELFIERHKEAYGKYQTRYNEFESKLKPLQKAKDDDQKIEALQAINEFLEDQQFGRKHQAYDPEEIKNRQPVSAEGKPLLLTKADYFRAGIESNPQVQLAALGDFDFSQLPGADDPAFLAQSDEVVISQMIQDLAAELEHDPVQIYHWVRNNIETIPGWGSYQNSELTLGARRGNPFDVASLTIALLRASQIPARYVMGVAEVDPERYTNWLGDFINADVASDYAVANGIAIQVVTGGGEITRVRTQHIWVQAAIDYFPSRGAKNRSANAWVDLDPSFKQYEYQQGLDVAEISGIDAQALATQFIESGTVDEDAGFVQNLDPTELLAAQEQAQQAIQDHIENNLTDPTVGDVIGGRRTIVKEYPTLPSGLPYTKFNQGATFGVVPSNLQNKTAVGFGNQRTVFPFAQVNNQQVTLQFTPATQADEDVLASLLPEGEITDVSQLPNSISSSLVRMIPELSLNGEVFRQGSSMRLGEELELTYQFSGPLTTYAPQRYSLPVGSYLNIPLVAQSVSPVILQELQAKIEQTQSILENGNESQIDNLTRGEILGDLFYVGGLGYYAQAIGLGQITNLQNRGSTRFENGFGSFGYEPQVNTFFGIPRGITTGGVALNMLFTIAAESHDGNSQARNNLRFEAGLISSALEHTVPKQMFGDPQNPSEGFSAVRGLELAAAQGQSIYQIDQSNIDQVMPQLNLDFAVEEEIVDSVRAGLMVITHTDNVSVQGFNGAGYLVLDPDTLIGAYKISGGSNGGFAELLRDFILPALLTGTNLKRTISTLVAASDVPALRAVAPFLALAISVLNIFDVALRCASQGYHATLISVAALVSVLIFQFTFILATGPFGGLIAPLIFGPIVSRVNSFVLETQGCDAQDL